MDLKVPRKKAAAIMKAAMMRMRRKKTHGFAMVSAAKNGTTATV